MLNLTLPHNKHLNIAQNLKQLTIMKTTITQNQIFRSFSRLQRSCCSAVFLLLFLLSASSSWGQTTNTWDGSDSNNWNTAANWSLNAVPTTLHDVVIPNNFNVTVNTAAVCKTLVINSGGNSNTITISSTRSLTVSGAITINAGTGSNNNKILAVGSGTLTCASISIADTTNNNRDSEITISTGTVNVTGNIVMSGGSGRNAIRFSSSGTLNVGGNVSGGNLIASSGTVNYNGSGAQTIGAYTYNNLTLSGSGTKTFANTTTVNSALTISTNVIANLGTATHSANTLSLGGNGQLLGQYGGTGSGATYINITFFSASTGKLNVDVTSCVEPTVNAGAELSSICQSATSAQMGGSVGGSATGGTWSGGAGSWTNASNPSTATYTASASESGTVTLTLTTSGGSCGVVTAAKSLLVNPTPTSVTISPASATICNGSIQSLAASGGTSSSSSTGIIGTGTNVVGSTTAGPNPLNSWYGGTKVQMIYTASELTTMGLVSGGTITSVGLFLNAFVGSACTDLTIRMKNTTSTVLSTFESGTTSVYGPTTFTPTATGWVNFSLTTSFTWTGGNVIIEFVHNSNNAGNGNGTTTRNTTTTGNSTYYFMKDNAGVGISGFDATNLSSGTFSKGASTSRPNVQLSYSSIVDNPFTWTPITGLYTNSGATTAYTLGLSASTVYAKPLETTTYTATATSSAGCKSTKNVVVTVNQPSVAPTSISGTTTICNGSSTTLTANGTLGTGANYEWGIGSTVGSNIIAGETASTLSVSPTSTTTYWVRIVNTTSPCTATTSGTTSVVTVNIQPNNATGTNGSSTISGCTTSGVAVAIYADAGEGNSIKWYNAAGNLLLDSGVQESTYSASVTANTIFYAEAVSANGCASEARIEVEAKVIKTSSWLGGNIAKPTDWFTASNWDCNSVPDASTNVVIPTGKTVSILYATNQGPAYARAIVLEGTANVTVTSDHSINVTNKVTVPSTATFTVQNNASLVQTDNVANEGNIIVQKSTPPNRLLKRNDAVLWSSPVVQNLQAISTGTPDAYFMQHDPQANSWSAVSSPATADFTKGKGFLVRTPSTFPTTATQQWSVNFTGVPNNGDVTLSAGNTGSTEKYLLVGNPYPSAINIAAFKAANPNITGVFYFYRKPNGVSGISSYGTLSADGSFAINDNAVGAIAPGDVIASGQGFFVAMKSDNNNGNVYFTNTMRVANDHGHFNRINTNLDSYKLIVQTPLGGNSQFITNYNAETTSGYDVGYDAVAFTDGTTDLSAIMNNEKYRIQARGEYNAADVIPVQFKTGTAGEHRIKLQDAQGVFAADQMVIIKDNLTGVQHNLTANGDYVFTATAGTFTNRFEVIYQQAYYTALQANSCGATIANMNSLVYADLVNGATGYRFKVVNNTTAAVQTIDRPQHWFAFNMLSAYDYNTPYTISVQVQKDGVWTGYYGATCTVNSPNIAATGVMQINPSQCGMTLPTIGTVIATTPVAGATGYKFRITNTTANAMGNNLVQEVTRTNHWFTLAMLTRYNYGSSYAIEVAVKTTAGYTPYGNACTVYAPAVPTLATCGQTVATATTLVRTTATTLATQYRFQVTRIATQETITFDTANYWFSFRVNVPGYAAGEQYGVRVAVMTAGAWSPYGDACDITAPIATARTTEEAAPSEANLFKPVAYPNPFASTFGISLATPSADVIHLMVYDLQGRLIEKQNVFVSQLDSLQIGTNYPSGDYLLVVAQGANIKSSHIHKD